MNDLDLLRRVSETVADHHAILSMADKAEEHRAVLSCRCNTAQQYRDLKVALRDLQFRELGKAIYDRGCSNNLPDTETLGQMVRNLGLKA